MKSLGGAVGFTYDAEGRVVSSTSSGSPSVTVRYYYDGEGNRIQKSVVGGTATTYVHDAFGVLAAEYSSTAITPACVTCYLVYDHLGSVRLVTDQASNVVARHDYVPYGQEIPNGTGGRSGNGFGVTGNVNQMFTGQERDPEMTPNTDFFNARYFSAVAGSFLRPDPGNAGAILTSPQSWNGYGYVGGNPLSYTDPTGLGWWSSFVNWVEDLFGGDAASGAAALAGAGASVAAGIEQQNQNPSFFFSTETTAYQWTTGRTLSALTLTGIDQLSQMGEVATDALGKLGLGDGKKIPPVKPRVCFSDAFVFAGVGETVPGTPIKLDGYAIPLDYDAEKGFSSGVMLDVEFKGSPVSLGYEISKDWNSGSWHQSGLLFGNQEFGGAKLGSFALGKWNLGGINLGRYGAGALVDLSGNFGAYGNIGSVGAGAMGKLKLFGCD